MFNFLTPNGMPYSSSLGNNSSVPGETISDALDALLAGGGGGSLQDAYDGGNSITVDNIIDINHDFSDTYARSLLAIDQLSIAMLDGGTYLGRTRVAENNYYISNLGRCWTVPFIPAGALVLGVAVSADGRIMFSNQRNVGMYRSLDYGITWTQNLIDVNDSWGIGMSADGKHVVRSRYAGRIYISHDYGTTFAEVPSSSVGWYRGFAVSADGKYMVAYWGNGGVSMSSDYGDTWYMTTSTCDNHSYASISSDGKIIIVGSLVENAQISYDYGDTWSDLTLVGAGLSSAMSASGRHIVAAIKNNSIYISHDYGRTWSVSYAPALTWSVPSMSDDGNIIVVSLDVPGSIYISKDRGLTWEIVAFGKATFMTKLSASGNTIISATIDGGGPNGYVEFSRADTVMNASNAIIPHTIDGVGDADMIRQTYAIRVDDASNIPYIKVKMHDDSIFELAIRDNIVKFDRVPSERKSITPVTPSICVSGAVSGDGKYIVIGDYDEVSGIFVSSDSGASFTTVGPVYQYFKSAVSHYGQYMLVASYNNQEVVLSVDSGATWNNVPDLTGIASWLCVGISDNGEYMAAAGNPGDIWVSSDFGSNWNNIYASGGVPGNISISGDGKYILVTYSGAGATLKLSSDYGATFAPVINPVGVVAGWLISAISFSGQYMIATTGSLKRVYISYDYGVTWNRRDTTNDVWVSAMSASGEIMYYSDDTTFELYQSLDYGVTWNVVSDPAGVGCDWSMMSCSGDGSLVLEVGRSAGINLYTYSMDIDFLSMPIKNRAFDSDIYASHSMIWLDENTNTVGVKVKKSDSTTFNAMFMHGKKIVEKILMPCVASGGVTASGADVFPAYGSRASVILDLNSSRWSSIGIPVVRFRIIGRQATAGVIMAYFRLYNQTDGVDIADSVLSTNLTTTYQVLTCTIPLANFPLTEKVISVQTSTAAGGSVALYSAEIEIEWTLF
jgi:photosystem II stability/assembly factor-like uncharacterized protein